MNDGGPVFAQCGWKSEQQGISLRDWFAGMALQGILANPETRCQGTAHYVQDAYNIADRMLTERLK